MGNPDIIGQKFNNLYQPKIEWGLVSLFLIVLGLGFLPMVLFNGNGGLYLSWTSKIGGIVIGLIMVATIKFFNYQKLKNFGWWLFAFGSLLLLVANSPLFPTFNLMVNTDILNYTNISRIVNFIFFILQEKILIFVRRNG
ncbi:hypothetical protein [Bacillus sp. 03113]|uniref:hypothetical protein n=1 Tax=Bacillus sp. 03113 TaxID=2578211 RepID=UPI001141B687|nr:hypothetical protein [Bacillus sp. 03113]